MKHLILRSRAARAFARFSCSATSGVITLGCFSAGDLFAQGAAQSPEQMLEQRIPGDKGLAKASKADLLAAVQATVQTNPAAIRRIVRAAVQAKPADAADIVVAAIGALGREPDCNRAAAAVGAALRVRPKAAAQIQEAALQAAPACAVQIGSAGTASGTSTDESEEGSENSDSQDGEGADGSGSSGNFRTAPATLMRLPGSVGGGGGGFDPQEGRVVICHNGNTLALPPPAAQAHLREHAGDTAGPCAPTPTTNQ